jgi:hypothetical protein
VGTGRAALVFSVAALVTLLAAATLLPEVSTGLTSVRLEDYQLAVSDIFGGNAFLSVLFLMASLISGGRVVPGPGDRHLSHRPWDTSHSRLRVGLDLQAQAPCLAYGARLLDGPGPVRRRDSGIGHRGPRSDLKERFKIGRPTIFPREGRR